MRRALGGICLLVVLGCGPKGPTFAPVAGTVTLDTKPIAEGKISFVTNGMVPEILDITDGKFAGKVMTGERRVEVAVYRPYQIPPDVPKSMYPLMEGGKENYLPARYHKDTILKATVAEKGDNTYTFDLTTKPD
jgi:hypothetical protein